MSRRIARTLSLTVLLLAGAPAIASPAFASRGVNVSPARQSQLAALTHGYFGALSRGLATGDVSGLVAVIAPTATLTQRSTLVHGLPLTEASTVHGLAWIIRFYQGLSADFLRGQWIVWNQERVSPTTVVVYAGTRGAQGTQSLYSVQHLTISNGKIVSLNLLLEYLP